MSRMSFTSPSESSSTRLFSAIFAFLQICFASEGPMPYTYGNAKRMCLRRGRSTPAIRAIEKAPKAPRRRLLRYSWERRLPACGYFLVTLTLLVAGVLADDADHAPAADDFALV